MLTIDMELVMVRSQILVLLERIKMDLRTRLDRCIDKL